MTPVSVIALVEPEVHRSSTPSKGKELLKSLGLDTHWKEIRISHDLTSDHRAIGALRLD